MNLKLIIPAASIFSLIFFFSGCERPSENNQSDDGLPPAVPAGLSLYFAHDGEVLIEWQENNEADLKGYNVYKSTTDSNFAEAASTKDNFFFDDSLDYDSTYFYRVSASDIWGRESSLSQEISAVPKNKYPPEAPGTLSINARNWEGEKSIFVSWQPNQESDIAGYNIYRSTFSSFPADSTNLIGFSGKENWTDTAGLQLLTPYYYKIKAVDKGGLISGESFEVKDQILKMPEIVFPRDDETLMYYGNFKFKSAGAPAVYKVVVQSNPILGTLWEKEINSGQADDTIEVQFDFPYVEANKEYYWRVAAYTGSSDPNSVTQLYKFEVRLQKILR